MQFHDQRFDFYQYKMIQYNKLTVKLSDSHLNKLKSAIKNEMGVVLRLSSDMVGDDETNFLTNYYQLIEKLKIFVRLLLTNIN